MSGRSFLLSAVAAAACTSKPEADPAQVAQLAAKMANNLPAPMAVQDCAPAELGGAPTVTFRTLMEIGGIAIPSEPVYAEWINIRALDAPAFRALAAADPKAKRQAAAELLAAPAWIAYHIDLVDAPIALGVKELKIGTVGARVVRYDTKTGVPTCVKLFYFQNDKAKNDWAIEKSNKAYIEPAIAQAMKDDLAAQLLTHVPRPPAGSGS